jgi:hypothetical protein
MKDIERGRTSVDIALNQMKKNCDKKSGILIQLNKNNRLYMTCIIKLKKSNGSK